MKLEVRELTRDNANGWLKELLEDVVTALSPDLECITLVLAEDFQQAKTSLGDRGRGEGEIGITRILQESKSKDYNEAYRRPWKGALDLRSDSYYVIVVPKYIRALSCIYETVSWGMAHEVSEGVVLVHRQHDWKWVSQREQLVLFSYHPNPDRILFAVRMIIREILANKYAAEHGFQREMLSTTSVENARNFAATISPYDVRQGAGYSRVHAYITVLSHDRSTSLEAAGHKQLADACLGIWEAGISTIGDAQEDFLGGYRNFRSKFLSSPLTAESLLTLFNTSCIASSPS